MKRGYTLTITAKNINTMLKKSINRFSHLSRAARTASVVASIFVLLVSGLGVSSLVGANSYQDQIRQLERQNQANREAVNHLRSIAVSYQDAISKLRTQISELSTQIANNEAQQADVQRQIEEAQAELDRQKNVLGKNIRAMYLEGQISTVEMLATSKNLSEFVDKEAYRGAVQRQVQETLVKIAELQNQLSQKKQEIQALLAEQNKQRTSLDAARAEQASMLAMNQNQQADYNNQTKSNQAKISELNALIAAQRNANNIRPDGGYYFIRFPGSIRDFDPHDYPYKNYGFSMSTQSGCGNPDPNTGMRDSTDKWGYCTRQCTSYAAWAVEASGRSAPIGYGNAKNWVSRAPASYVHRTPQVGDVAVSTAGTWGHVMYVEAVDTSNRRIYVSQYNQNLDGRFSYQWRSY